MNELARVDAADRYGATVVRVIGEVDMSNVEDVMAAIASATPSNAVLVVVDLSDTTYIDSAGITMLFRLAERLSYNRQQLRLVIPAAAPIRAVIELTSVDQVIPVDESLQTPAD
jgi:anti-anti-sigma factor